METRGHQTSPIRPRRAGCAIPLTAYQTGFWSAALRSSSRLSRASICADSARISGPLDVVCLQRSIEFVAHRHEALRTRLAFADENPVQIVAPPSPAEIPLIDMSRMPSKSRDAEARRYGRDFMSREVDLSTGPLFDGRLLRLSVAEHVLILATDHIISDAVSCGILSREVWAVYGQLLHRQEPILPAVDIQYPDLAVWQRETQDLWRSRHLPYWRAKLPPVASICVPGDYEASGAGELAAEIVHVPLGKALTESLREAARQAKCMLPILFLAVYSALMARWCQRDVIIVAMPSHGRHGRPELEGTIGLLAHPVYLRLQFDRGDNLLDLVARASTEYFDACSHDASRLLPSADPAVPTEIWFNWMSADSAAAQRSSGTKEAIDGLRIAPFPLQIVWQKKFYPFFYDTPSGVVVSILYLRDVFNRVTIERFGNHIQLLGRKFVENPRMPLADIWTLS
jgi:hypothetical protein